MGSYSGSIYFFSSDGMMEYVRRYRNSLLQMGRIMIGLEVVWSYPSTLLSSRPFMMMRGAMIVDMNTYTPIFAGSRLILARYFLRMVQLMINLVLVLTF